MRKYPINKISNFDIDENLAHRLEQLRNEKALSLEELSEFTDISRSTLSRIERGETSPTANMLGRLCSVYKITMSQLLLAIEPDVTRHLKFSKAKKWFDPDTGFTRVAISPPAENYNIEVTLGELTAGSGVNYRAPPIQGLEQHLVLLEGKLELIFDGIRYELEEMDCLALKLSGTSSFENTGNVSAKYLIINGKVL